MKAVLLLATVSALAACDAFGTVPEQEVIAVIQWNSLEGPEVTIPDTVVVNVPFQVVIIASAGCGSDAIPAAVSVAGPVADVVARAVIPEHPRGSVFTCEGRFDQSIGTVTFTVPGSAVVRVHGRDGNTQKMVFHEYPVFVRS